MGFLEKWFVFGVPGFAACLSFLEIVMLIKNKIEGKDVVNYESFFRSSQFLVWVRTSLLWVCEDCALPFQSYKLLKTNCYSWCHWIDGCRSCLSPWTLVRILQPNHVFLLDFEDSSWDTSFAVQAHSIKGILLFYNISSFPFTYCSVLIWIMTYLYNFFCFMIFFVFIVVFNLTTVACKLARNRCSK